jgi:hypothetical protein
MIKLSPFEFVEDILTSAQAERQPKQAADRKQASAAKQFSMKDVVYYFIHRSLFVWTKGC